MRYDIEKRLHRVKILLDRSKVECPLAKTCKKASNCARCNQYYRKCTIYTEFM